MTMEEKFSEISFKAERTCGGIVCSANLANILIIEWYVDWSQSLTQAIPQSEQYNFLSNSVNEAVKFEISVFSLAMCAYLQALKMAVQCLE